MDTYRVDVKSILDDLGGTIEVSDTLPITELDVGDEHFAIREPVRFDVTLANGGTGIVAMGTVTAEVTASCARCLVEFPLTISGDVDGYYVEPGHAENIPEEQEVDELDSEGYVDLLPEIMEALVLEAPFAPLHDEECAGICPECGADLNIEQCECASAPDPANPFASLGTLLENGPSETK
jgi:uncharacterized protein